METPQQLAALKLELQMRKVVLERQKAELHAKLQSRKVERQKAQLKGLRMQNEELERQKAESKAMLLRHLLRGDPAPLNDPSCPKLPEVESLHALMNSPLCAAALETGLDRSVIEITLRKRLLETGVPFQTPDDLINSALNSVSKSPPTSSPGKEKKKDPRQNNNPQCTAKLETGLELPTTAPKKKNEHQGDDVEDLTEEIERLKMERACKICWEKDITVLFLPCRHMISCDTCAGQLSTCPLCRKVIQTSHQAYIS